MDYRIAAVGAALLISVGNTMAGQAGVSKVQIIKGTCSSASNIAEGPRSLDLTKRQSRFYCDTAAITFFDDSPGHVLIDFAEKNAKHSPGLGFSGQINVKQPGDLGTMMPVKNVYLESGQATLVSDGLCKFFFKEQKLSGIACSMAVNDADRRTVAIVTFDVSPDQSTQSLIPPDMPSEDNAETLADGSKIVALPNGNKLESLADGTVWAVIHPNGEMLAIQLDPSTMPTDAGFETVMIINLPESDIVGAPQSERIQIQGNCRSRTYQIMGVLPYSGKNGGGLPDVDSAATEPEGVLRKVMQKSLIWDVFNVACKN